MKRNEEVILRELAYEYNLSLISVFPKENDSEGNKKFALVDFTEFRRAKIIAEKNDLNIEIFKKERFDLKWIRTGEVATDSFKRDKTKFGRGYKIYEHGDVNKFYEKEVKPKLRNFDDIDELFEFVDSMSDISNEINECGFNEFVVVNGFESETIEKDCMCYDDINENSYIIGLVMPD